MLFVSRCVFLARLHLRLDINISGGCIYVGARASSCRLCMSGFVALVAATATHIFLLAFLSLSLSGAFGITLLVYSIDWTGGHLSISLHVCCGRRSWRPAAARRSARAASTFKQSCLATFQTEYCGGHLSCLDRRRRRRFWKVCVRSLFVAFGHVCLCACYVGSIKPSFGGADSMPNKWKIIFFRKTN